MKQKIPCFNQAQAGRAWPPPTYHCPSTLLHCTAADWSCESQVSRDRTEMGRAGDDTSHLQQTDYSTASSHADFSSVGLVKDKLRNQSGQAENAAPC